MLPCISPCLHCRSDTDCLECLPGGFRESAPACHCLAGFSEDSLLVCVKECTDGEYGIADGCHKCESPC